MKIKYLAVASFVASVTTVTHAQSSVTLYGVIEDGVNYVSNAGAGRQINLVSGEWYASRWGLKGTEDLGAGLSVLFRLENGFDVNSGKLLQGGLEFGRASYVGLSSDQLGTLTVGRQNTSVYEFVGANLVASGKWGGGFLGHAGDIDDENATFRVNNSVEYSKKYGGFSFSGQYGLGGVAGDTNKNSGWGLGAGYSDSHLQAGIAFTDMQDPFISAYNNGANAPAAIVTPIYNAYMSARSLQIFAVAANYQFDKFWFGANYSNSRFTRLGADPGNLGAIDSLRGTAAFNDYEVQLGYQYSIPFSVDAAYNYTKRASVGADNGATYNQFSVGAHYIVSKRTEVYMVGSYLKASGVNSNGTPAVAALNYLSPASINHQGVVRLALKHLF